MIPFRAFGDVLYKNQTGNEGMGRSKCPQVRLGPRLLHFSLIACGQPVRRTGTL